MLPIKHVVGPSKLLILGLMIVVLSGFAAADMSFGSYMVKEEVTTSSDAEFEVKMMNLGESSLEVNINTESEDDIQINHIDETILQPSIITESTSEHDEDIEWFLLDDGRYVETQTVSINVASSNSGTKDLELGLNAGYNSPDLEDHEEGHSLEQEVSQSRTYSLTANFEDEGTSMPDTDTGESSSPESLGEDRESRLQSLREPFERFTGTSSDSENKIETRDDQDEENDQETSDNTESTQNQNIEDETSESTEAVTGMFSSAQSSEKTTVVLITGIVGSIIYLVTML